MQDLLADVASLGAIREKVVNISGTTYIPTQVPAVLQEMLEHIILKAQTWHISSLSRTGTSE